jgi:hypothetical protein
VGAADNARDWFARDFCAVAAAVETCFSPQRSSRTARVTPPDIETQILRYYHAEKWTIGTIAAQLHIHHGVVRRVIAQQLQAGLPQATLPHRPSQIDA